MANGGYYALGFRSDVGASALSSGSNKSGFEFLAEIRLIVHVSSSRVWSYRAVNWYSDQQVASRSTSGSVQAVANNRVNSELIRYLIRQMSNMSQKLISLLESRSTLVDTAFFSAIKRVVEQHARAGSFSTFSS